MLFIYNPYKLHTRRQFVMTEVPGVPGFWSTWS
jgi:hypothetical protein